MLFLVGADRHVIRVVEQDIGRHQARVGEQAGVDVVGVLCGFILELRHAGELAELRVAVEHPRELRVLGYLTLDEENAFLGVDAERKHHRVGRERVFAECGRLLPHGDRVQVGERVNALVVVLQSDEVFQRAEVVAEREIAGRLDHAQHAFLSDFCCVFHLYPCPLSAGFRTCGPARFIVFGVLRASRGRPRRAARCPFEAVRRSAWRS